MGHPPNNHVQKTSPDQSQYKQKYNYQSHTIDFNSKPSAVAKGFPIPNLRFFIQSTADKVLYFFDQPCNLEQPVCLLFLHRHHIDILSEHRINLTFLREQNKPPYS
jgi:hypothetical protein